MCMEKFSPIMRWSEKLEVSMIHLVKTTPPPKGPIRTCVMYKVAMKENYIKILKTISGIKFYGHAKEQQKGIINIPHKTEQNAKF